MSRRILIAGNWKMNKTSAEGVALVKEIAAGLPAGNLPEILVCPPYLTIPAVVEAAKGTPIRVGAENVHWAASGAYTGEVSTGMLLDAGLTHVIIGHSERRQYFGETDETVNLRAKAAVEAGLVAVVCVGETLAEREAGETAAVIDRQTRKALNGIADLSKVVIAYEPVWAIGTGKTATPDMAQEVHAQIRAILADLYGAEAAETVRILYGGSMKPANAPELLAKKDIDGGLIGGASLDPEKLLRILETANEKE